MMSEDVEDSKQDTTHSMSTSKAMQPSQGLQQTLDEEQDWDHDPQNARNFSFERKALTAVCVSSIGFVGYIYTPSSSLQVPLTTKTQHYGILHLRSRQRPSRRSIPLFTNRLGTTNLNVQPRHGFRSHHCVSPKRDFRSPSSLPHRTPTIRLF